MGYVAEGLQEIIDHFGFDNQKVKLLEECQEYIESMDLEEIADVFILSAQLIIKSEELKEIIKMKIARTIARIANGYYDIKGD